MITRSRRGIRELPSTVRGVAEFCVAAPAISNPEATWNRDRGRANYYGGKGARVRARE
jgi:hypothetical protein